MQKQLETISIAEPLQKRQHARKTPNAVNTRREGEWDGGAESFIEVYIYTPRAKREGVAGKYGCGWKMREWKKVEGEGEGREEK